LDTFHIGFASHEWSIPTISPSDGSLFLLIPDTWGQTSLAQNIGWIFVASLVLRAYSLGGGTYTGLEAVSNNVNMLVQPRVRNGQRTMLYMALSLAFTAGGIIFLYVLGTRNRSRDKR
jgi:amino acid transporter